VSRMFVEPRHNYRDIIFLCQECRGDLESKPVAGSARCRYECQGCHLLWVYGSNGWVRVQQ
jgi:hypothetical protein